MTTTTLQDLADVRCLVTGGASGIGAAIVEELVRRSARVVVLDLAIQPTSVVPSIACDVADTNSVSAGVARAAAVLDGLDVVVSNAGIGASGPVDDFDEEEWIRVLNVNVIGMARVAHAALTYLRRSERAAIVNTSSILSEIGVPNRVLYTASKGAVTAMTRAMAADLVSEGIRVNCVLPGTTRTPWVDRLVDQSVDSTAAARQLEGRQPIGRLVNAGEVAFAVANLASPCSAAVTGTSVRVDGGLEALRLPS